MATLPLNYTVPRDANMAKLPIANSLKFQDGAGTPIVSPKATVGVAAQLFTVPAGAVDMVFRADAAVRYGATATLDGASGQGYKVGAASSDIHYPCAGVSSIYIRAESGTVTVDFMFQMLG